VRAGKRTTHSAVLSILLTIVFVASAAGEEDPLSLGQRTKNNRFAVSAGAFFVRFNSSYSYESTDARGRAYLDLEGQLDLPATEIVGNLAVRFRIANRHHVTADYSRFRRSANRHLAGNVIDIGGTIIEIDGGTSALMNYDFVDLSYGYAFTSNERSSLIAKIGAHLVHLESEISFSGNLIVDGEAHPSDIEAGDSVNFALPLLGVAIEFQMARRWIIVNSVDFVYLPLGDTQGAALRTMVAAGFLINRAVGIQLGVSYNYERVEYRTEHAIEEIQFDFSGITASMFFVF
jgi:hypothetical protein